MPRVHIAAEKRRLVIERAQERCEYCQCRSDYATETFAIDHVIPVIYTSQLLSDEAAIAFSWGFYNALAHKGVSVATAYRLGCSHLKIENLQEYESVKLISQKDANKVIFTQ